MEQTSSITMTCKSCGNEISLRSLEELMRQPELTCSGCGQTSRLDPQQLQATQEKIDAFEAKNAKLDRMYADLDRMMRNKEW